jgi:amino acid transporter
VPVRIIALSGAMSLVAAGVDLFATSGDGRRYFSAALTVAIATILLAYLMIYPAFFVLRRRLPTVERPFRVPGGSGTALAISALCTLWCLLAVVCLLWPGLGTPVPDDALPGGFEGDRAGFEALVLGPVGVLLVLCVVFYLLGSRRAARRRTPSPGADPGQRS